MRKAIALPTGGMLIGFAIGLGIALMWGMSVATTGSEVASDFFSALAVLFTSSALGIVLLILLLVITIKFWYIMVPFFVGILVGLFILMVLGSSIYTGMGSSSVMVLLDADRRSTFSEGHGLRSKFKTWSVVS